jgi:UDP-N-acetyl-D-mannosaminuronate dehydrogenase
MEFLPFKPGLVGGHCMESIPLLFGTESQELGYHPEIF